MIKKLSIMTLEEAIIHCKEKACGNTQCAIEHRQLAEWLKELQSLGSNKNEIISPYFEYGEFAGVRVCVGDEDFVIAPKDYVDVAVTWEYAEKILEEDGISTWDYRQACFTIAYQDEINNVLEANGGDALAYYWTCTRADGTKMYIHGNKHLTTCTDNWTCFLRAVINLKLFPTCS